LNHEDEETELMHYLDELYAPRTLGEWARRSLRKTASFFLIYFAMFTAFYVFMYLDTPEKSAAIIRWLRHFPRPF
jgi:hypothetical protein